MAKLWQKISVKILYRNIDIQMICWWWSQAITPLFRFFWQNNFRDRSREAASSKDWTI